MGKLKFWVGALLLFTMACRPQPESPPTPIAIQIETGTAVSPDLLPTSILPPTLTPVIPLDVTRNVDLYFPIVSGEDTPPTPIPPPPTAVPLPTATPVPSLDFTAVAQELAANGQELAYVKVGFHVGVGGNSDGLDEWMLALDAAGVPFFLKSVDNAQPILFAQQLMRQSGVPHVLVYRKTGKNEYDYDVPNYDLSPQQAAEIHWNAHISNFPPELDPSLVWLETINEVDKNRSEWLGQFAISTAELALRDGYNWAAFGWSSGEPETEHWESPSMLSFLRLAAQHPDRLAIALHEYSYINESIGDGYPYKIGRFQSLFQIADQNGIPRPTVLITEWGWTYQSVPDEARAIQDISWASRLYAPYPQVKGAAIWYLGNGFGGIANETQRLIRPLTSFSLNNYYAISPQAETAPIFPEQHAP
ncbi:MAG: hypothetical protein AAF490_08690 [Chloroflexota bacterium]